MPLHVEPLLKDRFPLLAGYMFASYTEEEEFDKFIELRDAERQSICDTTRIAENCKWPLHCGLHDSEVIGVEIMPEEIVLTFNDCHMLDFANSIKIEVESRASGIFAVPAFPVSLRLLGKSCFYEISNNGSLIPIYENPAILLDTILYDELDLNNDNDMSLGLVFTVKDKIDSCVLLEIAFKELTVGCGHDRAITEIENLKVASILREFWNLRVQGNWREISNPVDFIRRRLKSNIG